MANYKLDIKPNNISLLQWAQAVNERNDRKAKESRDNMMNTLKILGLAGAAFKGNPSIEQSAEDYYNSNWADYSPEDQVTMVNLGFNPSLYKGMNPEVDNEFNYDIWGV